MSQMQQYIKMEGIIKNQHNLYMKYSSFQIYYFTNLINQIINEKRTHSNIVYEDVEYMCDREEYLKRWYEKKEFDNKMVVFKEYYFHHEDCARIFMKGIDNTYARWQDKKRDLIYKKLKLIYREDQQSYSGSSFSKKERQDQQPPIQHFLFQISDFNPYSKKYYLKVAAQKEKEQKERKRNGKGNNTRNQLLQLKRQLGDMVENLDLSGISVLMKIEQPKTHKYQRVDSKQIKMNFLKKKQIHNEKNKNIQYSKSLQRQKKPSIRISREVWERNTNINDHKNIQFQYDKNKYDNNKNNHAIHSNAIPLNNNLKKTHSIFAISSFAALNHAKISQTKQLNFNFNQKQKETYSSQRPLKVVIKSNSTNILPKNTLQKIAIRQISLKKPGNHKDQFGDKRLIPQENKLKSHKSQFSSLTSLNKPLFNIRKRINEHQYISSKRLQLKNI